MVAQYEYHPDQELHQHVHESKQSAVQPKASCNNPNKGRVSVINKIQIFQKITSRHAK